MEEAMVCLLSVVEAIVSDCNKTSLRKTEIICETNREMNETKCKTAAAIAVTTCAAVMGTACGISKIISSGKNKEAVKNIEESNMDEAECIENK